MATSPEHWRDMSPGEVAAKLASMWPGEKTQLVDDPEPPVLPDHAPEELPSRARRVPRAIQAALNDERPKVLLPGDNRILSDVAADCGHFLQGAFFYRNGEVLLVDDGEAKRISAQQFRTEAERHLVFFRQKHTSNGAIQADATMYESEARGIMAATQFTEQLRRLEQISSPRLPVLRGDGSIELLPKGYDPETKILTLGSPEFREDMSLDEGRAVLGNLFGEFEFADDGRGLAVSVAALVGLVGLRLMPRGSLRPAFVITKNAEGSGASTLADCIVWALLGSAPKLTLPEADAETGKIILTVLRDARVSIIFDNVKHIIGGASLEALISSAVYEGRLLGANESIVCPNHVTVICTANGASVTPDMRRRSLFVVLHLNVERAEDRQFKRPITGPVLTELRPRVLGAVWALIRHWDGLGRPDPSRSHSAFPEWARTVGGIVEHAGYRCPFETPRIVESVDADAADMRSLVAAMEIVRKYANRELMDLARREELFPGLVGRSDDEMTASQRSAWGRMLSRYHDRAVGEHRFFSDGKGHSRRFWAERIHG
jgi:hypothetical protein